MPEHSREWLRTFLKLDARADGGATVPARDVERQEDTVLRALALLDEQPGVVLADEVGMGKTYEALGVIAARTHENPNARALILTPGPDLNTKWEKEIRGFGDSARPMYAGFRNRMRVASTLAELVVALRETSLVVAPVSVFAGSRGMVDLAYLLTAWADSKELAGNQIAALFRRYRGGTLEQVQPEVLLFLDTFEWKLVKAPLLDALQAHRRSGPGSLDDLWKAGGYDAFENARVVDQALADLRFRVLRGLVPNLDLLVVDEAHKLKNADSVRATGVRTVFEKRFDKALFLTATPFQLTVEELRQVFSLFSLARSAPDDLEERADRLLSDVDEYKRTYDDLDRVWSLLDGAGAADFASWFDDDPSLLTEPEDPTLRVVVGHARRLLQLKRERIEPGFRSWMIRSLREDKRTGADPVSRTPDGASKLPESGTWQKSERSTRKNSSGTRFG